MAFAAGLLCGCASGSGAAADEMTELRAGHAGAPGEPEAGNWLLYRRTYDGHGFSPLRQINTDNVKDLVPVWTFATGVVEGHEAPPMVNNGVMFVTTPGMQVLALNAVTGDLIWRYKEKLPVRSVPAASDQSRGRAVGRQGLSRHGRCAADRAGREDRQGGVEHQGRRLQARRVHDA